MVFWLFSGGITTVIKGVDIFLNVAGGCRYIRVFELAVYLGTRAYLVVLF